MIRLESINPDHGRRGRYRFYEIDMQEDLFGGELIIHWGRIGAYQRSRTLHFEKFPDAERELTRLLNRRRNHGYEIKNKGGFQSIVPKALSKFNKQIHSSA